VEATKVGNVYDPAFFHTDETSPDDKRLHRDQVQPRLVKLDMRHADIRVVVG
jgi:hypothetical protein